MIPRPPPRLESEPWQRELAEAITDPAELLRLLGLAQEGSRASSTAQRSFPLRVPRYFAGLMRHGDPHDPLLAQVLPIAAELNTVAGFVTDPVGDLDAARGGGLLHKYHGRVLLITTGACAVHCRYCFRRHFPYTEHSALRDWQGVLRRLHDMPQVSEVILSGGDPLTLSDQRLGSLIDGLGQVPHLSRLRIHTRLPVVLPGRITPRLADLLRGSRLDAVCVIHANHPREVTAELDKALGQLRAAGVILLNQSVLLKSVNDDADTLAELSEALFRIGVLPYYLHQLDPVAGAAHFEVDAAQAAQLAERLRRILPGYLVPRLVREIPGHDYKVPLLPL